MSRPMWIWCVEPMIFLRRRMKAKCAIGEPYLRHPLAVAGLLTHLKTDVTAIVAGLLHDTLEDTLATPLELEQRLGKDVLQLVDEVHQNRRNYVPQLRGKTG